MAQFQLKFRATGFWNYTPSHQLCPCYYVEKTPNVISLQVVCVGVAKTSTDICFAMANAGENDGLGAASIFESVSRHGQGYTIRLIA